MLEDIKNLASSIARIRKKPLLLIYYPGFIPPGRGSIRDDDVEYLYTILRGSLRDNKVNSLDVLLHTFGGDPYSAYRLTQIFNSFADHVTMLVPLHAFSAGTLMCMGTNEIRMGPYAVLSPIDIHFRSKKYGTIYGISIDSYIEFVRQCKKEIIGGGGGSTKVEEPLLVELVRETGPLRLGDIFRRRTLTAHYADKLLSDYMFKNLPEKHREERKTKIIRELIWGVPSHEFEMDYSLCKDYGFIVKKMGANEFGITKALIDKLGDATERGVICKYLGERLRMPYFELITKKVAKRITKKVVKGGKRAK